MGLRDGFLPPQQTGNQGGLREAPLECASDSPRAAGVWAFNKGDGCE